MSADIKRPIYAADLVVFSHEGFCEDLHKWECKELYNKWQVLLVKRLYPPFKDHWCIPGGHVEEGETSAQAAARECLEEANLNFIGHTLQLVGVFDKPGRDPRGWCVSSAYMIVTDPIMKAKVKGGDDAKEAKWFPICALPDLAFDHMEILQVAIGKFNRNV